MNYDDPCLTCRMHAKDVLSCGVKTKTCHRQEFIDEIMYEVSSINTEMLVILEKLQVKVMKAGLAGALRNWEQQHVDIMDVIKRAKGLEQ